MTVQQLFDFPVHSVMTFDTFIVCDGNASAFHFAQKVANPSDPEKLLFLYGPSGSGKSHLLSSVMLKIYEATGQAPGLVSCRDIASDEDLISRFSANPALLLDDMDQISDSQHVRGALWQTFNDFYTSGRPIVLTSKCPPRELSMLDEHLVSRLLWGLVARSDATDDNSRRMILKKIADDRNVRIADDVIDYMLVTTSREVGHLVAAFDTLYRYSLTSGRKVSLALARQVREKNMGGTLL